MAKRRAYPKGIVSKAQKARFTKELKKNRAKGLSETYSRRVAGAIAKGKTRQQARGHKVKEHVERKQKEIAEHGISAQQIKTIIRWHSETFNPKDYREVPTEEELVEWTKENGYDRFLQYRKVWDAARKQYLSELKDGTWESRGMGYLHDLTKRAKAEQYQWLYYH